LSIAKPRTASLVETIGAGYRALNRRLWVLGIPAALSTYLWFGPTLGLGQLGAQLQAALVAAGGSFGSDSERVAQGILSSDVRLALAWLNFMPVLPPVRDASAGLGLAGPGELAAALVLINLPALLLSSVFLAALSETVSGERRPALQLVQRALAVARDIVRYLLALVGVGFVLALPFLAISAIVVATLPAATLGVLLSWYVALFWAYVYTGFAPEAILISRAGPLRAIYHSVHVVRRDLAGTLGLLLVSVVIASGLGVIWQRIATTPPGLALAILGSAYVGSGLSAARLVFYRERQRS
jgi:hypothetical protein